MSFQRLLAADLTSPRSVTVWVMPSALYALASDRLIAVVGRWVLSNDPGAQAADEGSAWRAFGGLGLWMLRLILDAPGTLAGFRRWVLAVAPVAPGTRAETESSDQNVAGPGIPTTQHHPGQRETPGRDAAPPIELAPSEKKREALIRLYEQCGATGDPRYGDRSKTAALAGEIARRIGYHPGTARRELAKYLAAQSNEDTADRPEAGTSIEAVA